MKRMIARCTCDGATKQKGSAITCNLHQVALAGRLKIETNMNRCPLRFYRAIIKLRFMMACLLGRVQMNLTLLSLRCAIIKLRFMMACLLGRVQINLTLLSLRCAIARG